MLLFVGVGRADQHQLAPTPAPPTPTARALLLIATTAFVANPAQATPNAPRDRFALRASARHKHALLPTIAPRQHLIATTGLVALRKSLPATQPAPWQRILGSQVGQTAPPAPRDSSRSINQVENSERTVALIPLLILAGV